MKAKAILRILLAALLCAAIVAVCSACRFFKKRASGKAETESQTTQDGQSTQSGETAHTHAYEWVAEVSATCTENGTVGHYHCAGCGKNFDADKQEIVNLTITATGHRYGTDNVCTVCRTALAYTEGLAYTLNGEGTAYSVARGSVTGGDVVIPRYYNELPVTTIAENAFEGCGDLTSIVIPDGVTTIEDWAFFDCSGLISAVLPDTLTSIGMGAFEGCEALANITIPSGITIIRDMTFYHCFALTSITIPNGVTEIGDSAFEECGLTGITIPGSVTAIEPAAFCICDDLTSVTLSEGLRSIGSGAFYSCGSLAAITIPASVTSIGEEAFNECDSLTGVTFSDAAGWYSTEIENAADGTDMDVTDAAANATNLKTTYCEYFWYRH